MEYGFKLNKKNADVQYKVEMQDCNISGNTVQYRLKDNSIIAYQLDENGYAIASTKNSVENVELTRTQLSVFQVLADFADKNKNGFDKKDLKKLDEFELGQKIVSTLATENSSYNLTHIEITKNSVQLSLDDYNGNEKKLKIEFPTKKFSNYFKSLFKSNKKEKPLETKNQTQIASIEVGNLEEQPIDPTNLEDNSKVTEPNLSKKELRRAQRKARKESKKFGLEPQEKKFDFKGEIEPEYYYAIKKNETALKIANDLGIPLSCIKAANPNVDWNCLQIGQMIIIPERRSVENIEIKSLDEVAEYTGLSKFYIEELLCNIEKNHSTVYDDAKQNGKKRGNYVGTLTVGYGHTGSLLGKYFQDGTTYAQNPNKRFELKRAMEGESSIIKLSEEDTYQILAQDLLNMRAEAEAYFGEAFNEAPQSIQDAIIDVIYNKGVDTGLQGYYTVYNKNKEKITKQKETPTRNLYENIINRDYVAAAQNVCYSTKLKGLNKRNLYRVIVATQELSHEERLKVLESLDPYCKEVAETLSTGVRTQVLEAWENAKNGIFNNFTL